MLCVHTQRHTHKNACGIVRVAWLQEMESIWSDSERLEQLFKIKLWVLEGTQRPRSLDSVSPIVNLSLTEFCETMKSVRRLSAVITIDRIFTEFVYPFL